MCIPSQNGLEICATNEAVVQNNQLDENLASIGYDSNKKHHLKRMFPVCLVFMFSMIVDTVVFPNVDKSNYFGVQNWFLIGVLAGLCIFFKYLNDLVSRVLNMAPEDLSDLMSRNPRITQFMLWVKSVEHIVHFVLFGLFSVVFVAHIVLGIYLLVRAI